MYQFATLFGELRLQWAKTDGFRLKLYYKKLLSNSVPQTQGLGVNSQLGWLDSRHVGLDRHESGLVYFGMEFCIGEKEQVGTSSRKITKL
jgi:hypothetical protein